MRRLPVLVTAVLLASAATANAQSFNCRRAHYADETTICAQPDLSRLDERLAAVFGRLNAALPAPDRPRLRQAEDNWVVARRHCGTDHDCIVRAYQSRIDQLAALVPGAPASPEPAPPPPAPVAAAPQPEKPAKAPERTARHRPAPSAEPAQQSGSSAPPRAAAANPPPASPEPSAGGRPGRPSITWVDPPPSK